MRAILIGVVGVCASAGASWGQPAPPLAPPASPAPAAPAPAPPAAPAGAPSAPVEPAAAADPDPVWQVYDDAFARAAAGDPSGANARLGSIAQQWPQHPAAAHASELVRASQVREPAPGSPDRVARGELVFWSTVGGAFTAANVCVIADCSSARVAAAVYTASIGGSLALALVASRHGVAQGEAQLYNSAQTWGSWNGLAINDGFANTRGEAAVAIGAQAVGLAAGIGLWRTWHPTQGDVALTNSFLLWSTVLTLWGHIIVDKEPTLATTVIAGDVGLVLGGLASTQVKMSRGRTLLIDVGGVLGILGGGLIAASAQDRTATGIALTLGTAAGLAIAAGATQSWDAPPVVVAPTRITGASGHGAWGVSAVVGF